MMEYGTKLLGKTMYIPRKMLTESVPGQIYHIDIKTKGVPNPEEAIRVLRTELPKKFPGLKVHWIEVHDPYIKLQITGSPFAWALLLMFLPQILALSGIVVLLIAVYLFMVTVPTWMYALLGLGAVLIFFGPSIAKAVTPTHVPKLK